MEPCKTCGADARYILDDGTVRCTGCYQREWRDGAAPARQPTGCKVFSATRSYDRSHLGEKMTEWLVANNVEVTMTDVVQSSDEAFHCVTIVVFFRERSGA